MLPIVIIIILVVIVGAAFFIKRRRKHNRVNGKIQAASREYFRYLNLLVLGVGSNENARQLCKVTQIWDIATTPEEYLAAMHFIDGVAKIALSDARDRMDIETVNEVIRGYRQHKNYLLWALARETRPSADSKNRGKKLKAEILSDEATQCKASLAIRYSHLQKPYTTPWENS